MVDLGLLAPLTEPPGRAIAAVTASLGLSPPTGQDVHLCTVAFAHRSQAATADG